jgi:Bacterial regulatory helix-turn-helix protein, lysR family
LSPLPKNCTSARAAERLHLSQPPQSQQIRRLEEVVGYALFVRHRYAASAKNLYVGAMKSWRAHTNWHCGQ